MEGGQGHKILGQVDLPPAVSGDKVVVGDGGLPLDLGLGSIGVGDLNGLLLLPGHILRKLVPHRLLKLGGDGGADGEDGGKTELADDLDKRGVGVGMTGVIGKQHRKDSFVSDMALLYPDFGKKSKETLRAAKGPLLPFSGSLARR